jgi:hypothetical protein
MSAEEQNSQAPPASAGAADAAPKEPKEPKEVVLGEDGKPLSKGELKKRAKEAESEFGCRLRCEVMEAVLMSRSCDLVCAPCIRGCQGC